MTKHFQAGMREPGVLYYPDTASRGSGIRECMCLVVHLNALAAKGKTRDQALAKTAMFRSRYKHEPDPEDHVAYISRVQETCDVDIMIQVAPNALGLCVVKRMSCNRLGSSVEILAFREGKFMLYRRPSVLSGGLRLRADDNMSYSEIRRGKDRRMIMGKRCSGDDACENPPTQTCLECCAVACDEHLELHGFNCGIYKCDTCSMSFPFPDTLYFHDCADGQCEHCGKDVRKLVRSKRWKRRKDRLEYVKLAFHDCTMEVTKPKKFMKGLGTLDLETRQPPDSMDGSEPIVMCLSYTRFDPDCVARADACLEPGSMADEDADLMTRMASGSVSEETFVGEDGFRDFIRKIKSGDYRGITFYAHNGGRFDSHFILNMMHKYGDGMLGEVALIKANNFLKQIKYPAMTEKSDPDPDDPDAKPLRLDPKFLLRDSMAHIPASLAKLGKDFGLETVKGSFPFSLLNREDYATLVLDEIPPKEAFGKNVDLEWHAERLAAGQQYDVMKECKDYCMKDCTVLLAAILKMQKEAFTKWFRAVRAAFSQFSYVTGAKSSYDSLRLFYTDRMMIRPPCTPSAVLAMGSNKTSKKHAALLEREIPGADWEGVMIDGREFKIAPGLYATAIDRATDTVYMRKECSVSGCTLNGCDYDRYTREFEDGFHADEEDAEIMIAEEEEARDDESQSGDGDENENEGGRHIMAAGPFPIDAEFVQGKGVTLDSTTTKYSALTLAQASEYFAAGVREATRLHRNVVVESRCEIERRWEMLPEEERDLQFAKHEIDIVATYTGGYVSPFAFYYNCSDDQVIVYRDVASLYPDAMTGEFPVGAPERVRMDEHTIRPGSRAKDLYENIMDSQRFGDHVRGWASVDILIPQDELMPSLAKKYKEPCKYSPDKWDDQDEITTKLCTANCETCGNIIRGKWCEHDPKMECADCFVETLSTECTHDDAERALKGVWTTHELNHALSRGARLLDVHEIVRFDTWEPYLSDFIFVNYAKKELASPWPRADMTDAEKEESWERTQRACETKFGKRMDAEWFRRNPSPAERQEAKIAMNSCYGKFAEKTIKQSTIIITNFDQLDHEERMRGYAQYNTFIVDPEVEGQSDTIMMVATFKNRGNQIRTERNTSVYIASMITAYARVKLFSLIEERGARALYCDTDSCMYVTTRDAAAREEEPSGFLGDFTRENYPDIREFVSLGPKTYAFKYLDAEGDTRYAIKGKGISNSATAEWSTKEYRDILFGEMLSRTVTQTQFKVTRGASGFGVNIDPNTRRTVRFTCAKRQTCDALVGEDGDIKAMLTVPFGYRGEDIYSRFEREMAAL